MTFREICECSLCKWLEFCGENYLNGKLISMAFGFRTGAGCVCVCELYSFLIACKLQQNIHFIGESQNVFDGCAGKMNGEKFFSVNCLKLIFMTVFFSASASADGALLNWTMMTSVTSVTVCRQSFGVFLTTIFFLCIFVNCGRTEMSPTDALFMII